MSGTPSVENKRWWIRMLVQPALFLACGVILLSTIGVAQRLGFLSAGQGVGHSPAIAADEDVSYICPMLCTPPQTKPGRCPVCGMELERSSSGRGDSRSITIDPASRRVANIHTTIAERMPMVRTIQAIGNLCYDESKLKTISAYVDGRLERLYADYTGAVVQQGDALALVYSPRLYSSQTELLLAKNARDRRSKGTLHASVQSGPDLYEHSRQRLLELGMTERQIQDLELAGEADSRMHVHAPMGGTVIEKLAVEGQYVKEGDAIYKLADLSAVWLMLELFPEDAAAVQCGQPVEAEVQSLPGQTFTGHVAFKDPTVDPQTRTVGVRVVVPNEDGCLRVGDYATATINVPVVTGEPLYNGQALVVPRDAVLMAGGQSVVYVETDPGRFEIRRVVLGPSHENLVVIVSGLREGERVATRGNFLIDSQMQLAGNPSLIDPTKAETTSLEANDGMTEAMVAALSQLSAADRELAVSQRICPVTEMPLGSMGVPPKVDVNGTPVFICCEGCRESLLESPEKYLARLSANANVSHDTARRTDVPPIGTLQVIDSPDVPLIGDMTELLDAREGDQQDALSVPPRQVERPQEGLR